MNPEAVLEAVSRMPISTWSYREENPATRHMGPMAQDFRSEFGLGDSDRYYYSVDGHGVALAAIQALSALVQEQRRRIETLEHGQQQLRDECLSGTPPPRIREAAITSSRLRRSSSAGKTGPVRS